jgi:hypothetical protein
MNKNLNERFISPPLKEIDTLRTSLNEGEKIVLDFFNRNLGLEWEIYIQPHLNGLRPDFVLLNPSVGIAVFEVKDWNLDIMNYRVIFDDDKKPQLWATSLQGVDFFVKDNPINKVMLYKESIANLYCPLIESLNTLRQTNESINYYNIITAGVIFTSATTNKTKALFKPFRGKYGVLGSLEQCHPVSGIELLKSNNIQAVFPYSSLQTSDLMKPDIAQSLRSWLVEPDFATTQRQPLKLNETQKRIARTRTDTGYRRIKGAAGSGKSVALAARAAQLSIEKKDVLVVTYNITLWHYLRDLAVRYQEPGKTINKYITWLHFHQWCKQLICVEAGLVDKYNLLWRGRSDIDIILETEMVNLVNDALDLLGESVTKYDAILVDEGQDYNPYWWETLGRVLRANGEMLLSADKTQDMYERSRNWTEDGMKGAMKGAGFSGPWMELDISYRMPPALIDFLKNFVEQYLPDMEVSLPESESNSRESDWPVHLKWIQVNESDIAEECFQEILKMPTFSDEIIAYSDIVLLVPSHKIGLECVSKLESKNINVIHVFAKDKQAQKSRKLAFFMGDARVKACTIHSFKGWESSYLVVAITEKSDLAATYVALSRLKRHKGGSHLTVISSSNTLREFGQTWTFVDKQ